MSILARRRLPSNIQIAVHASSNIAFDSNYVDVLHIQLPARNFVLEKMQSQNLLELHQTKSKTPATPQHAGPMFSVGSNEPSGAFLTTRERESRCETSAFKKFARPHQKQGSPKYAGA